MIKKSELRIGNIYQYRDKSYTNFGQIKSGAEIDEMEDNDFEPVTLTYGILEKAGFEIRKKRGFIFSENQEGIIYQRLNSDGYLNYIRFTGKQFKYVVSVNLFYVDVSCPIEYLHQLQNTHFALSGEELTITL